LQPTKPARNLPKKTVTALFADIKGSMELMEDLKRYSDRLRGEGKLPLQARVGVNTGEAVVRSIKTGEGHVEYTPIGHSTGLSGADAGAGTDRFDRRDPTDAKAFYWGGDGSRAGRSVVRSALVDRHTERRIANRENGRKGGVVGRFRRTCQPSATRGVLDGRRKSASKIKQASILYDGNKARECGKQSCRRTTLPGV
jgi:hypothetical protein